MKMKTDRPARFVHPLMRLAPLAAALALAGCGGFNGVADAQYDASRVHPISVDTDVPSLTILAARGKTGLTDGDRAAVAAFAAAYKERGHGALTVATPSGSPNAAAAVNVLAEVRDALGERGVPADAISYTPYRASSADSDAPLILSYKRYVATPSPCGNWSTDYAHDPKNVPPPNFGCATQNNLAAMLADPADLVEPRNMTPADAARRATVFDKYRKGESTASERRESDSGAVSEVNK